MEVGGRRGEHTVTRTFTVSKQCFEDLKEDKTKLGVSMSQLLERCYYRWKDSCTMLKVWNCQVCPYFKENRCTISELGEIDTRNKIKELK